MPTSGYQPPADARLAASLLLLRDGDAGLEVLMLRRAERDGDLRSGAAVFPGGVLDPRDRAAHAHAVGPDDGAASARLGVAEGGLDYLIAAVRETFEEVGLLLADPLPEAARLAALAGWRERLQRGTASMAELCEAERLRLDLRGLAYYSHWLTPPGVPKRFDTRFFAALAPAAQQAEADYGEAVELMWLTPRAALDPARELKLLPVTRRTLQDLARFGRAADAHGEALERRDIGVTMPRRGISAKGSLRIVLPDELPWAEVGRLDPEGRGDACTDIVAGRAVRLSPHVLRVTAPNPGPMTGPGTNTYLVGRGGRWTVIDPGPALPEHVQALVDAAAQHGPAEGVPGRIERILVTHTHRDHSPGAGPLAAATGAPVWGRRAAHPQWQDDSFAPARELQGGERIEVGDGLVLEAVHTPGHASNHLCYLLAAEKTLFTGDHVMQGSTVVINPPDGDMAAYLEALRGLLALDLDWLAPGHGFLVARPHEVLRGLIAHRLKREQRVVDALAAAREAPLAALLPVVYADVPAALHAMAQRSLLAHLLKLAQDGRAEAPAGADKDAGQGVWRWRGRAPRPGPPQ
jgi:glyoxylase-like metal-dependent hydrolase (beta-lactamase superfamily II)/8-oxo-dGTP pyrophosphatase MutT (NUDIX family)